MPVQTNGYYHPPRRRMAQSRQKWLQQQPLFPLILLYIVLELAGTKLNWSALQPLIRYKAMSFERRQENERKPITVFYAAKAQNSVQQQELSKTSRPVLDIWLGSRDEHYESFKSADILAFPVTLDGQDGQNVCVPSAEWQSWFFPTCNKLHELDFRLNDFEDYDQPFQEEEEEEEDEFEQPSQAEEEEEEAQTSESQDEDSISNGMEEQEAEEEEEGSQTTESQGGYSRDKSEAKTYRRLEEKEGESTFTSQDEIEAGRNFIDNYGEFMTLLGSGTSRDAWEVHSTLPQAGQESVVLKTFHLNRPFSEESYNHQRLDSIVTERLTYSPYVTNIYGYCGLSVLNELGGHVKMNEWNTPMERLRFARDLAAGLRDAHHGLRIDGDSSRRHHDLDEVERNRAMVVNADIRQNNVFRSFNTGRIKISDFNQGVFLGYNPQTQEPCGYRQKFNYWRDYLAAPEECVGGVQNEKTDVYHLGGMIFYFLTGAKPYSQNRHDYDERVKRKDSTAVNSATWILPQLPPEHGQSRDPSIEIMRNAIHACHRFDPEERASATEIFFMLDNTLSALEGD